MYFIKLGVLVLVGLLVGCDSERNQASLVAADQPSSLQVFRTNAIALDGSDILNIDGQIVRYDLVRKDKGATDRYVIESSRTLMGLESEIFSDLARRGYVRRVRQESAERFLVVYSRKGKRAITADYRAKKNSNALGRLTITIRAQG
ncbi:hypothetical protein ACIGHJ_00785 [Stutzerimonas kunmingensis]|uniref:hypothetical protein n=1 Tax=Stutzerimonas kunmingensis TaxID=1211807 RepID=UPI0037CFF9E6